MSSVDTADISPPFTKNVVLELDIDELSSEDSEPTFSEFKVHAKLAFDISVHEEAAELDIAVTLVHGIVLTSG